MVHQFYKENSKLGRPDDRGNVTSVTTIAVSTPGPIIKGGIGKQNLFLEILNLFLPN